MDTGMRLLRILVTAVGIAVLSSCVQTAEVKEKSVTAEYTDRMLLDSLKKYPYNFDLNIELWKRYTLKAEFDSISLSSMSVFTNRDKKYSDSVLAAYSGLMAAQSYVFLEDFGKAYAVIGILDSEYVKTMSGDYKWCTVYGNMKATLALKHNMDYPLALDYYRRSLDYARLSRDTLNECIILCNIASIYAARNDTVGISYAAKSYFLSKKMNNPYIMCYSSSYMGAMSYLINDSVNGMRYLREADSLAVSNDYDAFKSRIYMTYGEFYEKSGDYVKAEANYKKALDYIGYTDVSYYIQLCSFLGNMYIRTGRYEEAESILKYGFSIIGKNKSREYVNPILSGLSDVYYYMGKRDSALKYSRLYSSMQDSIFNVHNEREFNSLMMNYEKSLYENQIQKQKIRIMNAERNRNIFIFVFVVMAVISCSYYLQYRKSNRMYKLMVDRYQQYVKRMDLLLNDVKKKSEDKDDSEKALFDRIVVLMNQDKIYRKGDISLDKLAEILSTNRAYVSRAINRYAGMNFYSYINMLRINEATRILSDTENDIPLKVLADELGYNRLSSFYRVFQKETGCPPSKYREQVRLMSKKSDADCE